MHILSYVLNLCIPKHCSAETDKYAERRALKCTAVGPLPDAGKPQPLASRAEAGVRERLYVTRPVHKITLSRLGFAKEKRMRPQGLPLHGTWPQDTVRCFARQVMALPTMKSVQLMKQEVLVFNR